jgi:methionine-rich copper-binding protein CopC
VIPTSGGFSRLRERLVNAEPLAKEESPFERGIMRLQAARRFSTVALSLAVASLLLQVTTASGHAILVASTPKEGDVISNSDSTVALQFNVRIDGIRSRISLVRPDGTVQVVSINKQTSPDTLTASATGLTPGNYHIRWQVLAVDGHISNGEVRFIVRGS